MFKNLTEQTKSIIRHVLTAVGVLLGFVGITSLSETVEYLLANLDAIYGAVTLLIGVVTTLWGFFQNKERHVEREVGRKVLSENKNKAA